MRVPNMPFGYSRFKLVAPTKSCAMFTMAPFSDASPCRYCVKLITSPHSTGTLTSCAAVRWFFLMTVHSTLRCDVLRPSSTDGMDRSTLYMAKLTQSRRT